MRNGVRVPCVAGPAGNCIESAYLCSVPVNFNFNSQLAQSKPPAPRPSDRPTTHSPPSLVPSLLSHSAPTNGDALPVQPQSRVLNPQRPFTVPPTLVKPYTIRVQPCIPCNPVFSLAPFPAPSPVSSSNPTRLAMARAKRSRKPLFLQICRLPTRNFQPCAQALEEARRAQTRFSRTAAAESYKYCVGESQATITTASDRQHLHIPHLPHFATAHLVVRALHYVLRRRRFSSSDGQTLFADEAQQDVPPILWCRVTPLRGKTRKFQSSVLVRSKQVAQFLLQASPISAFNLTFDVCNDNRKIPLSERVQQNLLNPRYDSFDFQLGHIVSEPTADAHEHEFHGVFFLHREIDALTQPHRSACVDTSLAAEAPLSPANQDPRIPDSLVLNTVERKISVTTASQVKMLKAESLSDFVATESRLRIEISFRSLSALPRVHRHPAEPGLLIVCFPISFPPRILRYANAKNPRAGNSASDGGNAQNNRLTWEANEANPHSWVRTVDPTKNTAFSLASVVRVVVAAGDANALFRRLHSVSIAPRFFEVHKAMAEVRTEQRFQRYRSFRLAADSYRLAFDVRYMMECVLSYRALNLNNINADFWHLLAFGVPDDKKVDVLQMMYTYVAGTAIHTGLDPDFVEHLIDGARDKNDPSLREPISILRKCIEMCGVMVPKHDDELEMPGPDESDSTEEAENNMVDQVISALDVQRYGGKSHRRSSSTLSSSELSYFGPTPSLTKDDPYRRPVSNLTKDEAYIRRVCVTPTRVIAHPPEPDLLNRVLRNYSEHVDRFIRVSFCDEDGNSVAFQNSDDLFARVRCALADGVDVGGETFVFLAFGNSQLRDHSVWMYNETPDASNEASSLPTADEIRMWMGDFSRIRSPGKYVALT